MKWCRGAQMAKVAPITLDFETDPIRPRPEYPPKPVSFSLQLPEWKAPRFYAWGHYTGGNNCSKDDAARLLSAVYAEVSDERPLLCHNGKFDMDVAEEHFGLRVPPWHQFEDTMILLFLKDPHQRELGLKPSAERILGLAPGEQDAVKAWVLAHKKQLEAEYPEILQVGAGKDGKNGGIKPSTAGAFIAYAPGHIVEPYANGDVLRTRELWAPLKAEVVERGMGPAYDRERKVLPILLRNEREGIRTDEPKLNRDLEVYTKDQEKCDVWLRKALKAYGGNPRLADALVFNDVLRQAGKHGLLDEAGVERWLAYRANRNTTAHDYGEGFANITLKLLPAYLQDVRALAAALQRVFNAAA